MATATDFQIPRAPSLSEVMADNKVVTKDVASEFDRRMEEWRRNLQRNLIERFQPKATG